MMHNNLKKLHPDFWNGFLTGWVSAFILFILAGRL